MTHQELIKAFHSKQAILFDKLKQYNRGRKERLSCLEMEGWNAIYDYNENRFTLLTAHGDDNCLFIRVEL